MIQETSLQAYHTKVLPTKTKQQQIIINRLKQLKTNFPNRDYTNMELSQHLNWTINRVTPRILELRNKGLIIKSQIRNCQITGNQANAWKLFSAEPVTTSYFQLRFEIRKRMVKK